MLFETFSLFFFPTGSIEELALLKKGKKINGFFHDTGNLRVARWLLQRALKGAGQGFLLKPFCPTVKNSSPQRTLARAFCVYSLSIGPE